MKSINEDKIDIMLNYIKIYARENNGETPSFSDIIKGTGMTKSVAYRYLIELQKRGYINYSGKGTLRIASNSSYYKKYYSIKVPIYGSVICGSPEEEEQQNLDYLALPAEWIEGDCFILRARGDSMIDIGISNGDLVLVRRAYGNLSEYQGKVIVALTEDGNTLKRLLIVGNRPQLHSENPKYDDIFPNYLEIQGVVLRVIKQIE